MALTCEHRGGTHNTTDNIPQQTTLPLPVQDSESHQLPHATKHNETAEDTELTTFITPSCSDSHFDALSEEFYSPSLPTQNEEPFSNSQSQPFLNNNLCVIPYSQLNNPEVEELSSDMSVCTEDHSNQDSFTDFSDCEVELSGSDMSGTDFKFQCMGDNNDNDFDTLATGELLCLDMPPRSLPTGELHPNEHHPGASCGNSHAATPTTPAGLLKGSFEELKDVSFDQMWTEGASMEEELASGKEREVLAQSGSHLTRCEPLSSASNVRPPIQNKVCNKNTPRLTCISNSTSCTCDPHQIQAYTTGHGWTSSSHSGDQLATCSDQEWKQALQQEGLDSPVEDCSSPFINLAGETIHVTAIQY